MKNTFIVFVMLLLLSACSKVTLIDQTINAFVVSASADKTDRITVSWVTNGFYNAYQVLKSATRDGTYEPISALLKDDAFDDMHPSKGVTYYYKVRGHNVLGLPLFTTLEPALGVAGSVAFTPPDSLQVSQGESGSKIILTWDRVDGAVSYQIYRSGVPEGPYLPYTNLVHLSLDDNMGSDGLPMKPGDIYYYKIASVDEQGDPSSQRYPETEIGMPGQVFGGQSFLTSEAGKYADKILLTWMSVPNTKKYILYRSRNRNNMGEPIVTLPSSATSYEDTDVTEGAYYYTIFYQGNSPMILQQGETVKSYQKGEDAPAKPLNFRASRGEDPRYIRLSWDKVTGATSYEIARSISSEGPWTDISVLINEDMVSGQMTARDDPYAMAEVESFSYYYRVVALNPAPGEYSDVQQGWANKPPANITASKNYGGRVKLSWDSVPEAVSYEISYSDSETGTYATAGTATPTAGERQEYSHSIDISPDQQRQLYYRVTVETVGGRMSDPSVPVEGRIVKMEAPRDLVVRNNATTTESLIRLAWQGNPNAAKYRIYRATLMHKRATIGQLRPSDYVKIAEVPNNAYQDSLTSYPLRRYDYKIVAIDLDGDEGAGSYTKNVVSSSDKTTYRLPNNPLEMLRDVDKTIIEAQSRINNFGGMGSSGNPKGRSEGSYSYAAGTSAVSQWKSFSSFEIVLNGATSFSVNMGNMTASQSGPVSVSGLYTGTVTYNGLVGALGGFSTGGTITVSYAGKRQTFGYNELASLDSIRLTTEPAPGYPSYDQGGGGAIQSGWSR